VRAPGVKWTRLALRRESPEGAAMLSIYTAPVNHSLGPAMVSLRFLVTCTAVLAYWTRRWLSGRDRAPFHDGEASGPNRRGLALCHDRDRDRKEAVAMRWVRPSWDFGL